METTLRKKINLLLKYDEISLGEFFELLEKESYGLIILLLSLPSAMFFPAPGVSTGFAVIIFILAYRMYRGKPPWIPQKYSDKKITHKTIKNMNRALSIYLKILEKITKPRLTRFVNEKTIGMLIMIMCVNMFIPMPLTNSAPALSIFVLAFSLINKDGFIALIGIFGGILGFIITFVVIMGARFGYTELREFIRALLA